MSSLLNIARRATVTVVATGTLAGGLVAVASPASATYVCTGALGRYVVPRGGLDHVWVQNCAKNGLTHVEMGNTYKVRKTVRRNGKKVTVIVTKHETLVLDTFRNDAAGNGDDGFRIPVRDGNGHLIALGQHDVDVLSGASDIPFSVKVTR